MNKILKTIARACAALPAATFFLAGQAEAAPGPGDIIINEWNAVGPGKYLEDGESDPAFCGGDPVMGNGGDWVELVVVNDIDTLVNTTLEWSNDDPSDGTVTFVDPGNTGKWDNLLAGTVIIIRYDGSCFKTDCSYDPCGSNDWLIEVNSYDTNYISMTGDAFKTDNDGWIGQLFDPNDDPIQGSVGEDGTGADFETGSGINSQELGKLESSPAGPWTYNDGNCSSYGAPNCWNDGASSQTAWFTATRANSCL